MGDDAGKVPLHVQEDVRIRYSRMWLSGIPFKSLAFFKKKKEKKKKRLALIIKEEGNEANRTYITAVRAESGLRRRCNELEPTEAMSLRKERKKRNRRA
ncbi:hypothetical protein KOW79_020828 [Hemibagrus wyckioides]|uniref:Uncharacterized protein n=1 Tax=Hemibagrus wyckioides TaxID=337641 RepID=A0A9D3N7S8_9TELE|nr:hypothetical protein KOW79_020828 [Hemibagrus wyckioides]